jgi:hypothetical protein
VHSAEFKWLPRVDLEEDLVGQVEPRFVVADGLRRNQFAVLGDAGDLNDRRVEVPEEALPSHLRYVREVQVHVFHFASIYFRASDGVGLLRHS